MILPMSKVRIMGPRELLPKVMPILQDFGQLHLSPPKDSRGVTSVHKGPSEERRERQLGRIRESVEAALRALGGESEGARVQAPETDRATLSRWATLARRVRREAEGLRDRRIGLQEEQAFLSRYRDFFGSFQSFAEAAARWPGAAAYHVVLPQGGQRALGQLKDGLREMLGDEFALWSRELRTGETGVLILIPRTSDERVEELFRAARVQEIELPGAAEGIAPAESIPQIARRLDAIPSELRGVEESLARLRKRHANTLRSAQAALIDQLACLDMVEEAGATSHAFILEGWLPSSQRTRLEATLEEALGSTTVVEEISREEWVGENVPVVMHNPRLFRPFETLVRLLPLPRYGSMDPTPFLAIFFPMFFGIVLGDVGYGLVLAALALLLRHRSPPGSTRRALAEVAGACSAFAVIFGFLYGELFGNAGTLLLGMRPLAFDRQEALLPFLGLALAIGVVHTLLGLVLNLISKAREGARAAIGPGVTLVMVVLVVLAILAAVDVLPRSFFTPAVFVVLILFPALLVVEGILGATELVSTLGHILSYARVMAVGTASVMMAVVANRMVGAVGSVVVGSLFALLFHLVNFVLGVFSPTVHALRLHFVEFFGTFYSPGGVRYKPFGHWSSDHGPGTSGTSALRRNDY